MSNLKFISIQSNLKAISSENKSINEKTMLAFRPYDTNNAENQSYLGLSPPAKKCDKSPGKVPIDADLLYRGLNDSSDFKFSLKSVTMTPNSSSNTVPTKG